MARNTPSSTDDNAVKNGSGPNTPPGDHRARTPLESLDVAAGRDESIRDQLERILAAARELRPQLREEQAATEKRGYYSEEMHRAFVEAGFFHVLLPKQHGGMELGVEAFFQVISEVARGCPSSAWCLCLGAGRTLQVASYWPERAHREIFGQHGYLVSPMSGSPQPDVVVVREERDGVRGMRISGTWKYCSGAPHSTHLMAGFDLPSSVDGKPAYHWAVLPRSSYTVLDDWGSIIGMKGSGSHSIHVETAFVPEHHVVETTWMAELFGDTAGTLLYGNPTYGAPFNAFGQGEMAALAVGIGMAAIDEYERIITTSKGAFSNGELLSDHPFWQTKYGNAVALVDSAVAMLSRGGQLYEEYARRSVAGLEPFTSERSTRLNNLYLVVEEQVWEAVEMLVRSAGSRHLADGARLQRYFRDMATVRGRDDQFDLWSMMLTQERLPSQVQGVPRTELFRG